MQRWLGPALAMAIASLQLRATAAQPLNSFYIDRTSVNLCWDDEECLSGLTSIVTPGSVFEVSSGGVVGGSTGQFTDAVATLHFGAPSIAQINGVSVTAATMSAGLPQDHRAPYKPPVVGSDAEMNFTFAFLSDPDATMRIDALNLTLHPGSYQFTQEISNWSFAHSAGNLTYEIFVKNDRDGQTVTPVAQPPDLGSVGGSSLLKRWNLSDDAVIVFPTVGFLADDTAVPAELSLVATSTEVVFHVELPPDGDVRYTYYVMSAASLPAPAPAPAPATAPQPAPSPAPILAPTFPQRASYGPDGNSLGINLCTNSASCNSNGINFRVQVLPFGVDEYKPYPDINTVRTSGSVFSSPVPWGAEYTEAYHGSGLNVTKRRVGLAIPYDGHGPYALPPVSTDAAMHMNVTFFSAPQAVWNDAFGVFVYPGSVEISQQLDNWDFSSIDNSINITHHLRLVTGGSPSTTLTPTLEPMPGHEQTLWRITLTDEVYALLPKSAVQAMNGSPLSAYVDATLDSSNVVLEFAFRDPPPFRYSYLISSTAFESTSAPVPDPEPTPELSDWSGGSLSVGVNVSATHPIVRLCYDSPTCTSGIMTSIVPGDVTEYEPHPSTTRRGFSGNLSTEDESLGTMTPSIYNMTSILAVTKSFPLSSNGSVLSMLGPESDPYVTYSLSLVTSSMPAVNMDFGYLMPEGSLLVSLNIHNWKFGGTSGMLNYTFDLVTSTIDGSVSVPYTSIDLRPVDGKPELMRLDLFGHDDFAILPTKGFDGYDNRSPLDVGVTVASFSSNGQKRVLRVTLGFPVMNGHLRYDFFLSSSDFDIAPSDPPASEVHVELDGGQLEVCFDDRQCEYSTIRVGFAELTEYAPSGANQWVPTSHAVQLAGDTSTLKLPELAEVVTDSHLSVMRSSLKVLVPENGSTPSLFDGSNPANHPVLTYTVTHFDEFGDDQFDKKYYEPVPVGSVEVSYVLENWSALDASNSINLTLRFENTSGPLLGASVRIDEPVLATGGISSRRMHFGDDMFLVVPMESFDADDKASAVWSRLENTSSQDLELHLAFTIKSTIKYSLLMSSPLYTLMIGTRKPVPTPTKAANVTGAGPNTTLSPESFATVTMCFSTDCNEFEGLMSLSINNIATSATYDSVTHDVSNGVIVADFLTAKDELRFSTATLDNESKPTKKSTKLLATIPASGGLVSSATEKAFNASVDDIRVAVQVDQLWTNGSIHGEYDTIETSKGGFQVSFEMFVPSTSTMTSATVSLLISAFEDGDVVTNATRTTDKDVVRVAIGKSMYLDIPTCIPMRDNMYCSMIGTKYHETGEFAGLIEVVVHFASVYHSVGFMSYSTADSIDKRDDFLFGSGSSGNDAAVAAAARRTVLATPPPNATDGVPVKTKMLLLPRGQFGMCYDAACQTTTKVAFTALGSVDGGGSSKRFANSPAFQFSAPTHVVQGNTEIWRSSFQAIVPNSKIRPPLPLTSANQGTSEAVFGATVDQYLTAGNATNGNQVLSVPRGGLKFSINISNWQFVTATDKLVLTMALASMTGASSVAASNGSLKADVEFERLGAIDRVSLGGTKFLDVPREALADGAVVNISIVYSYDVDQGIVLSLEFPMFKDSVFYDPVIGATELAEVKIPNIRVRTTSSHSTAKMPRDAAVSLIVILGYVLLLAVLRLIKRVPMKFEFAKVLP